MGVPTAIPPVFREPAKGGEKVPESQGGTGGKSRRNALSPETAGTGFFGT
jgi:hypothetical protein